MENINSLKKVYTERQISVGTFIGGPLASGFFISQNYKALDNADAARKSIYLGIIVTIIFILFLYLSPHYLMDKIPTQLIPVINLAIVILIFRSFQREKINNFLKDGGKKESYWKTISIGLLSMIITIIVLLIVYVNKAPYDGDLKTFGKTQNSIYYDTNIPSSEIDIIGAELTKSGFFNDEARREVQLRKEEENIYHMFITADKEFWNNTEIIDLLSKAGEGLDSNLHNKKIRVSFYSEGFSKTETKEIR